MPTLREKLGRAVRHFRERAGVSQEALADQIRVHRTYIGTVERGEANITLDNIEKIADGLSVTVTELFLEADRAGKN